MQAIQVPHHGSADVLELVELPDPQPGPGEVVVATTVAGINFIDTYQRQGIYPRPTPFVPGSEGAGTIAEVGAGVEGFAVGDRVTWKAGDGSYATHVVVSAAELITIPDGVSDEIACAAILQGLTAHYLTHSVFPIKPGQAALVHAAAGGVGQLLTQIITRQGARVIATASTQDKRDIALKLGASEALGYEGFADAVKELTGGRGVEVVYDGVGKATFDESLRSLAVRGTLALYGGSSGQVPAFELQRLAAGGSLYVTRPTLAHFTQTREELEWRARDVFDWIQRGEIAIEIGARYPLAQAAQAHKNLEARSTTGKLLLVT